MILLDARPQFLDALGSRLSLGRLVIYKATTTTLADVWLDNEHTIPALNPYPLTDAGWTDQQLFLSEAVTVHVQDSGEADIKVFDIYQDGSIDVSSSSILVDTIADLADIATPVDGATASVKGYYTAHDLFVREYIYDALSTATPDGGAVIASNTNPNGRWIYASENGELDAGIWGVLVGVASVNSQIRAAQEYCALNGIVLRISKGLYTLVGGGTYSSICQLNAQKGVVFSSTGGVYNWTIQNPLSVIASTLAGSGVHLVVNGKGWEDTVIPDTAWDPTERGYDEGSAVFRFRITATEQLIFNNDCSFATIEVDAGVTAVIACDSTVHVGKITGLVDWSQSTSYPIVRDLVTSTATTSETAGELMCKCDGIVTLDSTAFLSNDGIVTAYVNAIGDGVLTWANRPGERSLTGGFGGKDRFIVGPSNLNSGTSEVSGKYFNAGNIVSSYNVSTSAPAYLDLMGLSAVGNITRDGKIINGAITGYINNDNVICEDLTVTGNITSKNVKLLRVTVNHSGNSPVNGMISSQFRDVVLTSTASTAMQAHFADWENVTYNHGVISVGGESHLRNVSCSKLTIRPDSSGLFRNFTYDGGSIAENIVYDAANGSQSGVATMYNTSIKRITGLSSAGYGDVLNGPVKKWAVNGHYNIDISENERGLSTRGTGVFALTLSSDSDAVNTAQGSALFYILGYEKMLFLGPNSTTEFLTNCELFANVYRNGDMKRSYASSVIHSEMGRLSARQFIIGTKQTRLESTGSYIYGYPSHASIKWSLYL